MKQRQKETWLPWTCANVWEVLTNLQALAFWAQLHVCEDAPNRSLVPGAVLQWEKAGHFCATWLSLTVEQMRPCHLIHCSFSTRACRGSLAIRLTSEEGDEATTLAVLITVEQVVLHRCFWILAPLVRTVISLRIRQAFRRLDALLEDRQEQTEQGVNTVYTYWQQVQAERECFRRQLMAQSTRSRSR